MSVVVVVRFPINWFNLEELTPLIGHPSCMQLTRVTDVVHAYPWKCIECKNCELCQEKGDDVCFWPLSKNRGKLIIIFQDRILFCDWCDRGTARSFPFSPGLA